MAPIRSCHLWLALLSGLLLAVPTAAADGPPAEFLRAQGSREWAFPRDHGQHPGYRLEWWYYTGNLATASGRRFGYQVTFFRLALPRPAEARTSAWAADSLYLAHAALSDVARAEFHSDGRAGRGSLGVSGAALDRHAVWLGPWRADALVDDPHGVTLTVPADGFTLMLTLRARKPPVLHGENGLDQKGPATGQASWYYSLTRLETMGTIEVPGERHKVSGTSWMDHEFGTSQLAADQAGWDWFAIRLDDGSDLMLYRLRGKDGSTGAHSGGSLIDPAGGVTVLLSDLGDGAGYRLEPRRRWRSPDSDGSYPVAWRIAVPQAALELETTAAFDAQELLPGRGVPFPYWEGAITVRGTRAGQPVSGEGYMELTGYTGNLTPFFE